MLISFYEQNISDCYASASYFSVDDSVLKKNEHGEVILKILISEKSEKDDRFPFMNNSRLHRFAERK
jgi:hypothetical protein